MNKAFLFDMDGVLVNSEPVWEEVERERLTGFFGPEVFAKIGSLVGLGVIDVMKRARELGAVFDSAEYLKIADDMAKVVYARSPITENVDMLVEKLLSLGFRLGLVTQSPPQWVEQVVPRLSFMKNLETLVSLYNHPELARKPSPDGYMYAFKSLGASPQRSVVLEDSNFGIQSGKASGAFTIGYRGNLVSGYEQEGADAYADTMADVEKLVEEFTRR